MYLALYRKYRPKLFKDLLGQDYIINTLKNQIKKQRIAHAYIFTGPRGSGKTSLAKIFSKTVNCKDVKDGEPCLNCEICHGLEAGDIYDISEIDAASNNGVDNIREIREECMYTPSRCKYRVYIIDEVHMLSVGAFNALLKIMEEPPGHLIFILATTNIEKVPLTVISRCQRFDFKKIEDIYIESNLRIISKNESVSITDKALEIICELSGGGMRDALSILDQCIGYSSEIDERVVNDIFGMSDEKYLNEFVVNLLDRDVKGCLVVVEKLFEDSKDIELFCEKLIKYFRDLLVASSLGEDLTVRYDARFLESLKSNDISYLINVLNSLQNVYSIMNKRVEKRIEFEKFAIEMSLITPENLKLNEELKRLRSDYEDLKRKLDKILGSKMPKISRNEDIEISNAKPEEPTVVKPVSIDQMPTKTYVKTEMDETESVKSKICGWDEILEDLSKTNRSLYMILNSAKVYKQDGTIRIESENSLFVDLMKTEGNAKRLIKMVYEKEGIKYKVMIKNIKTKSITQNSGDENKLEYFLKRAKELNIEVKIK